MYIEKDLEVNGFVLDMIPSVPCIQPHLLRCNLVIVVFMYNLKNVIMLFRFFKDVVKEMMKIELLLF